jgi:hypothetical protein
MGGRRMGGLTVEIMDFRIGDTFTDSLARLTGEKQKVVKPTVLDLQINLTNPKDEKVAGVSIVLAGQQYGFL